MSAPALYDIDIVHVRSEPVRHTVRRRSYQWLVELDDSDDPLHLPRWLRPLARIEARDHLGRPERSIRANLDAYLAEQGVVLGRGRVRLLTNARSLGYVFNPLSVYWVHAEPGLSGDEPLIAVVAEVHNTYGQRHCYLLRVDDAGRAEVDKQFYVSPFYPVDGSYRMSLPEPGARLSLTVTLHRPDGRPFTASVRGERRAATPRSVLATAVRHPAETWRVRAAITAHGLRLWAKGLPVAHRPVHEVSPTVGVPHNSAKRTEDGMGSSDKGVAGRLAGVLREVAGLELPVRLRAWDGSEAGPSDAPTLVLRNRRAIRRILWSPGELGLARAYVSGDLDVEGGAAQLRDGFRRAWAAARSRPDSGITVTASGVLRAAVAAARLGAIGPAPAPPASEAQLSGRRHTRGRDRAAIAHHYDLSNDFYALLLDESMAYSSAYYTHPGQSLPDAQRAKLDMICRKLGLHEGMHLLDVGCGWGSLIIHAARHYGVHATGVTLSAQQRDHVTKRIADAGLGDRVTVLLQDYRELADAAERYDAVSSIEMGEHVGEEQYPVYAGILFGALKPGGRLLLQQMSRRQDAAPGGGAFIESYIAPDMHMRPVFQTVGFLQDAGFEIRDVHGMREHYVTTVEDWTDTFEARAEQFRALVGEEVLRVWRLYLVGGALSFEEGRMGVDQILAVKQTADGRSLMPPVRESFV